MTSENKHPHTILIIDDDADARMIVSSAVSVLGFIPIEASDGQHGLSMFAESVPDLVILDMMMPGLSGNQVCEAIKSSKSGEHVPVMMLTARDSVRDKVDALDGGADDYLTKPFHYQELQARIRALIRVRELNLRLHEKNEQLEMMQQKLVEQERQLVAAQMGGTAAHSLGQPLSAILLNCHLLENPKTNEVTAKKALGAIRSDAKRMVELLEQLKSVDAKNTRAYYGSSEIIDLPKVVVRNESSKKATSS